MSGEVLVAVLFLFSLFIFGFVKWAKSSLKTDIENDAKQFFGAKEDISGNLVMEMYGYTVLLDYDLAYDTRGMAEYTIANIVLPKLNDLPLKRCKKIVDIQEDNGKYFAIIYASWGYQGEKFRRRLEEKLNQLTTCIDSDK